MKRILWRATALCLLAAILSGCALGSCAESTVQGPLEWDEGGLPVYMGGSSYPRMCQLQDGTLLCAFDSAFGGPDTRIAVIRSEDGGEEWSWPDVAAEMKGYDCANPNLIQLENGDILLAYRAVKGGEMTDAKLLCSVSHDNGVTWQPHSTIVETLGSGGVWEPHFIMIDGKTAVFYANDSSMAVGASGFQNIEFKLLEGKEWGNTHVASYGNITRSRDGMPVVDRLSDGRYVMVVEANAFPDYSFVVQIKFSPDGLDWSQPLRTIYTPSQKGIGKKAGAPYIVVLPGDILAVSFQTDEDAIATGDYASTMKVILSQDLGETWCEPFEPFPVPEGKYAVWNGMYWANDRLFALTGSDYPFNGIYARTAVLRQD